MAATKVARSGRAKIAAALAAIVAMTVGFFTFAPNAFAHHPILSGVSSCEEDGTYTVDWSIGNSETAPAHDMLIRAWSVTPNFGTTTGLTADAAWNGLVGPSYPGPGTVVPPDGSVPARTTGIPGDATSITLHVTGFWKYGNPAQPNSYTYGTEFTVQLRDHCNPTKGALEISKVVTGQSAPPDATYTIGYDNGAGTSGQVTLKGGESATVPDLPFGSYTLTEIDAPPGATITPNPAVVGPTTPTVSVTVKNPYPNFGGFEVTKRVTGETGGYVPGSTFTVSYDCGPRFSGSLTLVDDETKTVIDVPIGATCTLNEVSKPATSGPSYVYGPEVFTPSNVITIGAGGKVKVTLENPIERISGGFSVTKQVTGATGGYVPGSTFTVSYDCDNEASGELVLLNGDTKGVGGLPLGTECTLTEVTKPATSGPSYVYGPEVFTPSNVVTIVANDTDNVVGVTLENPIEQVLGGFSVTKQVTGETEGYVPGSEFAVSYSCDDDTSGQLVLADGETGTVDDLPLGTECTLTEVTKPATSGPSYVYGPEVFTPSNVVTIVANGEGNLTKVTLNNPLDQIFGAFSITKQVTGETDGYVEDSTFTVSYDCSNDVSGSVTIVDGETRMVEDLPVGTQCTLNEVTKPATSGPSYVYGPEVFTPSNIVTVGSTSTVAVTLENPIERLFGGFSVTKQVTGETDGYVEGSTFTVSYTCDNEVSGELVLVDGETAGVGDLPLGTECTLTEVTKPATSGPSYVYGPEVFSPSNVVTIVANDTDDVTGVTLENPIERRLGAIAVTKQVTGETEGYVEDSEFGFTLDCSDDDFDESFTLRADETATFEEIPLGTTCTVTEVSVPDPVEGYEYQSPVLTPDDGTVTVESTTKTVTVTVANPLVSVPPTTPSSAPSGQSPDVDVLDTTQTRGTLPTTGSNVFGMVVLAVGLVLAGASLIGISRRRS